MIDVYAVVATSLGDPDRPSGGNRYVDRMITGLPALGHRVTTVAVDGTWPTPGPTAHTALATAVAAVPDGVVLLVDGLIAAAGAETLVPAAARVHLVPLTLMPLVSAPPGHPVPDWADERATLRAASRVVVPSPWTARQVVDHYGVDERRVVVVEPGTDPAPLSVPSATGRRLLCVAVVAPHKGHDVLIEALARCADLDWQLTCVGAHDRAFVERLRRRIAEHGLAERVRFTGPLTGTDLDRRYADADLLVLATRGETFGMVVTEALARGIPVLASDVGGVPEALGTTAGTAPRRARPRGRPGRARDRLAPLARRRRPPPPTPRRRIGPAVHGDHLGVGGAGIVRSTADGERLTRRLRPG